MSETTTSDTTPNSDDACCKIGRVAARYGVEEYLAETIGAEWEDPDGDSLRENARRFNQTILRTRYAEAVETPLDAEVETAYDLLRGEDDANDAQRRRVQTRLDRHGIDVDRLREDFVSYRTVDRHFKQCTGREKGEQSPLSSAEATDNALERVRALQNRLADVSEKTLEDLSNANHISASNTSVTVSIDATCLDCGTEYSMRKLVTEGCPVCAHDNPEDTDGTDPGRTAGNGEIA